MGGEREEEGAARCRTHLCVCVLEYVKVGGTGDGRCCGVDGRRGDDWDCGMAMLCVSLRRPPGGGGRDLMHLTYAMLRVLIWHLCGRAVLRGGYSTVREPILEKARKQGGAVGWENWSSSIVES